MSKPLSSERATQRLSEFVGGEHGPYLGMADDIEKVLSDNEALRKALGDLFGSGYLTLCQGEDWRGVLQNAYVKADEALHPGADPTLRGSRGFDAFAALTKG